MGFWQDLRFAARLLLKEPWFTTMAVTALALGIGVNTTVFTVANAVLLRGLPLDDPGRLVAIGSVDARGRQIGVSKLDFEDWRREARTLSGAAVVQGVPMNISEESRAAEQYSGVYTSASLFDIIGQRPLIGRGFLPEDDSPETDRVVVLAHTLWTGRYGGDPNILGRAIRVNALPGTIVGVMAPDMRFPFNTDVWVPISKLPPAARDAKRDQRNLFGIGRLAPGVTMAQARAELQAISMRLATEYPTTNKDLRASVVPYLERANGPQLRLVILALMGSVAFVLLIACANVANLLLARSASRSREISTRVSLGAGRWRIVRQLLIESVLLSTMSGVLGFGLAWLGVRWFDLATADTGKPYWMTFAMDPLVFVFLTAISVATGVVFGLAPALHVSKTDVNEVLKEGGGRSGVGGRRTRRWASTLIVVEVVLTVVLLAGAGFMMRSFLTLYRLDLGFDPSRLLRMQVFLPFTKYPRPDTRAHLYEQLDERLRGIPAIEASAVTSHAPLFGGFLRQLVVRGRPSDADHLPEVTVVGISPGYFDTLGTKIQRGRVFSTLDGTPGHESVIVNERFVAMHFPAEEPLGRQIELRDPVPALEAASPRSASIVGVVRAIRQRNFQEAEPDPVVYLPYQLDLQQYATLVVRARGSPGQITTLIREEMRAIEPDVPLVGIQTMDQSLAQQRWPFRVFGTMFLIFALIALILSAVGLYAVTAYAVTQRTSEIGIRMALGARPLQVLWLVVRRSLVQLAVGVPLGVAGAIGVGHLLQSLLVQTSGGDPVTIGLIATLMILVSIAACLWPAGRAMRLDPASALRYE